MSSLLIQVVSHCSRQSAEGTAYNMSVQVTNSDRTERRQSDREAISYSACFLPSSLNSFLFLPLNFRLIFRPAECGFVAHITASFHPFSFLFAFVFFFVCSSYHSIFPWSWQSIWCVCCCSWLAQTATSFLSPSMPPLSVISLLLHPIELPLDFDRL